MKEQDIIFLEGNSYKNRNMMVGIPTRGMIHYKVISSWKSLLYPINSKSVMVWAPNMEIGEARNKLVESFLKEKDLDYLLFIDDDLILQNEALLKLFRGLDEHSFDVIGSVYRLKDSSRDVVAYIEKNGMIESVSDEELLQNEFMEVHVVGMGFTLIHRRVLEQMPLECFKTVQESCSFGTKLFTEDVYFCRMVRDKGFKIGLSCESIMGHIDTRTQIIY